MTAVRPVDAAQRTYRYLRLGTTGVLLALAVSVAIEVLASDGCWQRSISAYYYTPTRPVLVGALVVLGFAMVVLVGRTPAEEVALDLAGLLAPVVAFVPTTDVNTCSLGSASPVAGAADTVTNNVATYLVVVVSALVALQLLPTVSGRLGDDDRDDPMWARTRRASYAAGWLFAGAYAVWWWAAGGEAFRRWAHSVSAVLLFVCIVVVVAATAYDRTVARQPGEPAGLFARRLGPRLARSLRSVYGVLAVAMVLAFVLFAGVRLATGWTHWVLAVEVSMISLFAVFWLVQTVELWDGDPPGRPAPASRSRRRA